MQANVSPRMQNNRNINFIYIKKTKTIGKKTKNLRKKYYI